MLAVKGGTPSAALLALRQRRRGRVLSRRVAMLGFLGVLIVTCCYHEPGKPDPTMLGINLPILLPTKCQSEVCMIGEWLACDSVPIHSRVGATEEPIGWISPNETYTVIGANALIVSPGLVRVVRDTLQRIGNSSELFHAGDTLQILDDLGEGRYNTWYQGGIIPTEAFWPLVQGSQQPAGTYAGVVLRESRAERWFRVVAPNGGRGWIQAARNSLSPVARSVGRLCI